MRVYQSSSEHAKTFGQGKRKTNIEWTVFFVVVSLLSMVHDIGWSVIVYVACVFLFFCIKDC